MRTSHQHPRQAARRSDCQQGFRRRYSKREVARSDRVGRIVADAAITGAAFGDYRTGNQVAMVGIPALPHWRQARSLEFFGPRHFGREMDYVPS